MGLFKYCKFLNKSVNETCFFIQHQATYSIRWTSEVAVSKLVLVVRANKVNVMQELLVFGFMYLTYTSRELRVEASLH